MIVWLWDAPGTHSSSCGVSDSLAAAQQAACDCLAAGQILTAEVQEAELLDADADLEACYWRIGGRWQARRTNNGAIRWYQLAAEAVS